MHRLYLSGNNGESQTQVMSSGLAHTSCKYLWIYQRQGSGYCYVGNTTDSVINIPNPVVALTTNIAKSGA